MGTSAAGGELPRGCGGARATLVTHPSPGARTVEARSGGARRALAPRGSPGGKQWGRFFWGAPVAAPAAPRCVSTTRVRLRLHTVAHLALPHWPAGVPRRRARVRLVQTRATLRAARGQIFSPNRGGVASGARRTSTTFSRGAATLRAQWEPGGCQERAQGARRVFFLVALRQTTARRASGGAWQRSGAPAHPTARRARRAVGRLGGARPRRGANGRLSGLGPGERASQGSVGATKLNCLTRPGVYKEGGRRIVTEST